MRKTAHVTLFGVLAIMFLLANWERKKAAALAWLLATLYGATDEVHQIFEAGRTPAITDVFIDSFGALIALSVFYLLRTFIFKSNDDFSA